MCKSCVPYLLTLFHAHFEDWNWILNIVSRHAFEVISLGWFSMFCSVDNALDHVYKLKGIEYLLNALKMYSEDEQVAESCLNAIWPLLVHGIFKWFVEINRCRSEINSNFCHWQLYTTVDNYTRQCNCCTVPIIVDCCTNFVTMWTSEYFKGFLIGTIAPEPAGLL